MAVRIKVGDDRDIAIPEDMMKRVGMEPGTSLLIEERDGYLVLLPEPRNYAERLRGLHREVWEGIEPQEYVRREREAWTDET